jgi:YD repeat-containing protein
MLAVVWLAILFTAGLAQADNKGHGAKEPHTTQAVKDHAPAFELKVTQAGTGKATITSSPAGIDCGTACRADFAPNTVVTLTASPATSSTFGGWAGACTGTATACTVTLDQARSVSATFSAPAITTYQYDANGNLTQITDPLGRTPP